MSNEKVTNKSASAESKVNSRSIEFKVLAYQLHMAGMTSKQALLEACARTKTPVSPGMEQYPGSYMHDYKKTMQKLGNSNDADFLELLKKYTMSYDRAKMQFALTATVANPALKSTVVTGKVAEVNKKPSVSQSKVPAPKTGNVKATPKPQPAKVKEVTPARVADVAAETKK